MKPRPPPESIHKLNGQSKWLPKLLFLRRGLGRRQMTDQKHRAMRLHSFSLLVIIYIAACNRDVASSADQAAPARGEKAPPPNSSKVVIKPQKLPAATGDTQCDAFVKAYAACVAAQSESVRHKLETDFQSTHASLLRLSQSAGTRPHLAAACKQAEQRVREQLSGLGCEI